MRGLPRPSARVLWVVAAVLAAVLTGFWLRPHHSARDRVATYIEQANATGKEFTTQYRDVQAAYKRFSLAPGAQAAQTRRLRVAAARLASLRADLAKIQAPPEARQLRTRLLAFYDGQVHVATEVLQLMTYFPQLIVAEKPLGSAVRAMQKSVGSSKTPRAQAKALGAYAEALKIAVDAIDQVEAPPLLAKARAAERSRIVHVMRSIRGVRAALLARDRKALKEAVDALAVRSDAATLASRAAILAYNRDVKHIEKLGVRVERERQRLDKSL